MKFSPAFRKINLAASARAVNIFGADRRPNGRSVLMNRALSHIIPVNQWLSGWIRTCRYALWMSILASSAPGPSYCIPSTASCTPTYDSEDKDLLTPLFTLTLSGVDISTISRHFPEEPLGMTPKWLCGWTGIGTERVAPEPFLRCTLEPDIPGWPYESHLLSHWPGPGSYNMNYLDGLLGNLQSRGVFILARVGGSMYALDSLLQV